MSQQTVIRKANIFDTSNKTFTIIILRVQLGFPFKDIVRQVDSNSFLMNSVRPSSRSALNKLFLTHGSKCVSYTGTRVVFVSAENSRVDQNEQNLKRYLEVKNAKNDCFSTVSNASRLTH